jgi:transcriptional regulator with XRE-family HTH domain
MKTRHEKAEILLGKRIRRLREEKALSQQELGNRAEVNYKYIGEIERGRQNPSFNVLTKIAIALGVSLSDLMSFEQEIGNRKEIESRINQICRNMPDEEVRRVLQMLISLYPTYQK